MGYLDNAGLARFWSDAKEAIQFLATMGVQVLSSTEIFDDCTSPGLYYADAESGECFVIMVQRFDERKRIQQFLFTSASIEFRSGTISTSGSTETITWGSWASFAKAGDITTAINALDVSDITANLGADKTLTALSETDGKISATASSIQITESQVTDLSTDLSNLTTALGARMKLRFDDYTTIPENANLGYTQYSTFPPSASGHWGTTVAGDYTTPGVYVRTGSGATIKGRPTDYQGAFLLIVRHTSAANRYQQELYPIANVTQTSQLFFYKRYYTGIGWGPWAKFEGTAVTTNYPSSGTNAIGDEIM